MSRTPTLSAIALSLTLVAPAAAATWLSYGTFEPDTPEDTGFQWECPPFADADPSDGCDLTSAAIKNRVYFNVFPKAVFGVNAANGGELNPNVGALGTRIYNAERFHSFNGVLGVWIDCNRDGYIGMAETAVREYSSNVPGIDKSICPDHNGKPRISWNGEPNYNGWVTELLVIGNRERDSGDLRLLGDDGAMVWGDPGRPGVDVAPPGAQCTQQPVRGDGRSTGGFLYTLDCRGQNGRVQAYNDATAGTGLEFEDTDPRDSSHPANQAPPILFGDDCTTNTQHTDPGADGCEQDHAAVHVQDCSQSAIVPKPSTFPGSGDADDPRHPQDHLVRPVPANPVNTDVNSWTIAGQVNATLEEVGPLPRRTVDAQDRVTSSSNCDATDDEGNDVYGLYEIRAGALARGKNGATWNFQFNTATRGSIPANAVSSGGSGAATDLGVELRGAECQASDCTQSGWFAGSANGEATVITLTKGNVGEDEDQDGNDDGTEFGAAPRWTFYAKVSDTFLNGGWQLPGGTGVYGSEQCTGDTTGVSAGNWDCKASNWYLRSDGSATEEPRPFARVHDAYNLRDVDCLDGRIGDTGVTTSVASMGDDACE